MSQSNLMPARTGCQEDIAKLQHNKELARGHLLVARDALSLIGLEERFAMPRTFVV